MSSHPKRLFQTLPTAARAAQTQGVPRFNTCSFVWLNEVGDKVTDQNGHKGIHPTHRKQQLGELSAASGKQTPKERGCTSLPALAELLPRLGSRALLCVLTSKGKSVASSSHRLSEEQGKFCRPTNLY